MQWIGVNTTREDIDKKIKSEWKKKKKGELLYLEKNFENGGKTYTKN